MEGVKQVYPMRSVIRCKAKQQLLLGFGIDGEFASLNEGLFREVAKTFFQSNQFQAVYLPYESKEEVAAVESRVATELMATYKQVKSRRDDPVVQQLNALL